jgi:acetoin utilization protein AcuC
MAPAFISSEIYRATGYRGNHPLAIARVGPVMSLCEMLGWFTKDAPYLQSPQASLETITRFHTPEYVAASREAEVASRVSPEAREAYNIGTMENPVFQGLYERASTSVGGSILAAEAALERGVAFHPAGGTHHGLPNRANGFCFFNDPVFSILTLLDHGKTRVLYIDLDAHHGDGVEAAFADDPRVMTISMHEENRWPFTGRLGDVAAGRARNIPVPRKLNDSEFDRLIDGAILPMARNFAPDAMVLTCGADPLRGDPLSSLDLSNTALIDGILRLVPLSPATVVLGGGGYNPWTVARFWTALWGRLAGFEVPKALPAAARELFETFDCDLVDDDEHEPYWFDTLLDPRNDGPVREEIVQLVEAVLHLEKDLQPA